MTAAYPPGEHALLDFRAARGLDDRRFIIRALRRAAKAAGATVLRVVAHGFGQGGGLTAVAVLAESHISIHTWPEEDYAAIDIFVCGRCRVEAAIDELIAQFQPREFNRRVFSRKRPGGDRPEPQS